MISICPYSKYNICIACNTLKIQCNGEKYLYCEQYNQFQNEKNKKLLEDFLADLDAATDEEILAELEQARENSKDAVAE